MSRDIRDLSPGTYVVNPDTLAHLHKSPAIRDFLGGWTRQLLPSVHQFVFVRSVLGPENSPRCRGLLDSDKTRSDPESSPRTRAASSTGGFGEPVPARQPAGSRSSWRSFSPVRVLYGSAPSRSSWRSDSASIRATGFHWLVEVGSELAPRMRSSARSRRCRRRAGGCAIRCRGRGGETSTRSRSLRRGLPLRSRRRREPTTPAIWLGCASRRRGCRVAGEGGHATAPLASCVSPARRPSSASSMTFSWSRSTG